MMPMTLPEARLRYQFALHRFGKVFGKDNVLICLYDCGYCVGLGATNAGIDPKSRAGLRRQAVLIAKYQEGLEHRSFHSSDEQFDLANQPDRTAIVDQLAGEVFEALCAVELL